MSSGPVPIAAAISSRKDSFANVFCILPGERIHDGLKGVGFKPVGRRFHVGNGYGKRQIIDSATRWLIPPSAITSVPTMNADPATPDTGQWQHICTSRALFFDSRFLPQPRYHSRRNGEGRDR